jgi:hypothetical protein
MVTDRSGRSILKRSVTLVTGTDTPKMVGAGGFEPPTPRPPGAQEAHERARGAEKRDGAHVDAHEATWLPGPSDGVGSAPDTVEVALAAGIERASKAGEWAAVHALVQELEVRRKARSSVVSLDAARRRRGGR